MSQFPAYGYKHIKMLELKTGKISIIPLPDSSHHYVPTTAWMAALNNDCLVYGVVYFIDTSCLEKREI